MRIRHHILEGIIVCSLCCSMGSTQSVRNENGERTTSNKPNPPKSEGTVESPVSVVGEFTNVQNNGEHQWGYALEIWRQEDQIYGLFSGSSNSRTVGDPPTGILTDQVFDKKTGKFSFNTRTTSYAYNFDGILTKKEIKGRLLNTTTQQIEKIVLNRDRESSLEMMEEYGSYEEWKAYADRILKFRGPK